MRLKQVVLPAPFGPISAWMVPADFQIDVVDGLEAAELLGERARFDNALGAD